MRPVRDTRTGVRTARPSSVAASPASVVSAPVMSFGPSTTSSRATGPTSRSAAPTSSGIRQTLQRGLCVRGDGSAPLRRSLGGHRRHDRGHGHAELAERPLEDAGPRPEAISPGVVGGDTTTRGVTGGEVLHEHGRPGAVRVAQRPRRGTADEGWLAQTHESSDSWWYCSSISVMEPSPASRPDLR